VETGELLRRWQPRHVLMVGIAGDFTTQGVHRGDVLVANFVHYYEPGKQKSEGEERRFRQYRCDRILWAKAKNYEAAEWKGEIDAPLPLGFEAYLPRAHFGPIGCGEKVVATASMIDDLLIECPQMLGVAMEAAGVAMAVKNGNARFLEIRGVSDAADVTKDDA
jgi:nucleoside phosphorylase